MYCMVTTFQKYVSKINFSEKVFFVEKKIQNKWTDSTDIKSQGYSSVD